MEHLRHFTQPIESLSPPTAYLSQMQSLQLRAGQALATNLVNTLSVALGPTPPRSLHGLRVAIPEDSILGNWLAVYWKAINRPAFLDWADALDLDLSTLSLQGPHVQAKTHTPGDATLHTFTLADASGWGKVAFPILAITQLIDTGNIGLPYMGNRVEITDRTLSLELALAFHGYPMPDNSLQVLVIVDELRALNGFPGVDDSGQSKSVIHSELINQQLDYQQLVRALEEARIDGQRFDWLQAYRKRLTLRSDSLLAHTMKNATRLLGALIGTLDLEGGTAHTGAYYYDYEMQALCLTPPSTHNDTRCVPPASQAAQWQELERLADTLQSSVYLDETFSIASLLSVYGIQRPASGGDLTELLQLLRQWSPPAVPYISESARSFTAVYAHRKYLGMLNDRYRLQMALQNACSGKNTADNIELNTIVDMDPDVFGPALEKARQLLLTLTEDPNFVALREAQGIDPDSHVLLTLKGQHLGARGLDGQWKQLNVQVLANRRLRELLPPLLIAANHNGGELRSNGEVSLRQALTLCEIEAPHNVGEALKTARLLAIPLTIKPQASHYWRALTLSQPSRWTLSQTQNQLIIVNSQRFLPTPYTHLFAYLSEPILKDKLEADIRAEADFLLINLLQSPRARALGEELSKHVDWHGRDAGAITTRASRKALVLAALILSLNPTPHAPQTPFDLTDSYLWSESLTFVRYNFEVSLAGLSRPSAALAAHLLLSNQSPELLIRGIPESLPYMTSQAWLLFKHYVMYTEQELSGSSRQLSYDDFTTLAHMPASTSWTRFINHRDATASIAEWAVANGVLAKGVAYSPVEINQAIKALNEQRERLKNALAIFSTPFTSLRETALQDPLLGNINVRFGNAFARRLDQLQVAYVQSITYWLSHLSLPRREALEYGQVECFSLSKAATPGRFATLVYVQYFSDRYFYEFFPLHYLILPRRDLEYARVMQAVNDSHAPKPHAWKRFDWPAYSQGRAPDKNALPALQPEVIISKLDVTLPVSEQPERDESRPRAPQTLTSPRSTALATLIVQRQLLMGSTLLRESALKPLTVKQALEPHDPWTAYVNHLVPNGQLATVLA